MVRTISGGEWSLARITSSTELNSDGQDKRGTGLGGTMETALPLPEGGPLGGVGVRRPSCT